MKLTDKQLQDIEAWASLLFSHEEVAILLDVDGDEFIREVQSQETAIYKAYEKGRLYTEIELRKKQLDMARAGSAPALEEMVKIMVGIN